MRKLLVFMAVMALPQAFSLPSICTAGPRTLCSSRSDGTGRCVIEGLMCGSLSLGKGCWSIPSSASMNAGKNVPPQSTPYVCQCTTK